MFLNSAEKTDKEEENIEEPQTEPSVPSIPSIPINEVMLGTAPTAPTTPSKPVMVVKPVVQETPTKVTDDGANTCPEVVPDKFTLPEVSEKEVANVNMDDEINKDESVPDKGLLYFSVIWSPILAAALFCMF